MIATPVRPRKLHYNAQNWLVIRRNVYEGTVNATFYTSLELFKIELRKIIEHAADDGALLTIVGTPQLGVFSLHDQSLEPVYSYVIYKIEHSATYQAKRNETSPYGRYQ